MNSLIEWVNRAGELWLAHALEVSWQIAILATAFLLLDRWLARRVRAVVRHAWWCLVLLKLVLPPNLASPTSAGYWLHATPVQESLALPLTMAPSPEEGGVSRAVPTPSLAPNMYRLFTGVAPRQPDQGTPLSWEGGLYLLWLAGVAGLASMLIHRARRVSRVVRGAAPADREHAELLRGAAAELGLKRLPRLLIADGLGSPAVCGLWRPAIVLPPRLVTELGTAGLRPVLLHELAHVRRGDLWVNLLQAVLQALYWWHPLVWVANSRMRAVREEATDEMVVVAQRGEVENYAQTLVTVARSALRVPTLSLGLVGIMESRRALKSRVERLLSMAIPQNSRLGWAGWCSLPLLAAALLPMAPRPVVAAASTPVGSVPAASSFGEGSTSVVATPRARVVTPETLSADLPPPSDVVPRTNPVNDSLARIHLEGVDFSRWTLEQVARYLTDESRLRDPQGRGVRFVVDSGASRRRDVRRSTSVNHVSQPSPGPAGEFASAALERLRAEIPAPSAVDAEMAELGEVDLGKVVLTRWDSFLDPHPTLREVVDAVVATASSPIQAFTGDFQGDAAVVFYPRLVGGEGLVTRTFRLDLEQVRRQLSEMDLPGLGDLDDDPLRRLPAYLSAKGFSLQPPNFFYLKYRMGLVMVRASPPEVDAVERALHSISKTPAQVEIETKVWEIPESLVRRLELDALVARHPVAGQTNLSVLTRKEFAELADRLERQGGLKPWATPRITTLDRRRAEISVRTSAEQSATVPLGPRDILSVVVDPTVAEDGYAITMACEGRLTELVDLRAGSAEADRAKPVSDEAPVFSVNALGYINHAMDHTVTVYDGQSALVLVPGAEPISGLGASASPRRFLLAMSPRLVDPAGNRVHAEGHLPRPADEVPGAGGDAKPGALLRR